MELSIQVDRDADGQWTAQIAEAPEFTAQGSSRDQAEARVQAKFLRVLADMLDAGETEDATVEWVSNGPCDVDALEPELRQELERRMGEVLAEERGVPVHWSPADDEFHHGELPECEACKRHETRMSPDERRAKFEQAHATVLGDYVHLFEKLAEDDK